MWAESFDHRGQLARLEGSAVLDTNRGRLTLPAEPMPRLEASGRLNLGPHASLGLARAESVVLPAGARLDAPDALEIRAANTVRIAGELRAGPGGVFIAAGHRVEISGRIEARGPIEIVLRDPSGVVAIDGEVVTVGGGPESGPARIDVRGRGAVEIGGRLAAEHVAPAPEASTPEIRVGVYGDIALSPGARLEAGAEGRVELSTNARVRLDAGAHLEGAATWTVGARRVEVAPGASLEVGQLALTAETTARFGEGARVASSGAELAIVARTLTVEGRAELLGVGPEGTSLRLEAARRLEVREGARVAAETPACGDRGQVVVRVAGPFVGGERVAFEPAPLAARCPNADPSRVLIEAHAFEGVVPRFPALEPPAGETRVDPGLQIVVPPTAASIGGRWTSRPLPAAGGAPRLAAMDVTRPAGTSVRIALGVADGPEAPGRDFVDHDPADPDAWAVHAGAAHWVVRVYLAGRRFDAPVVRHLAIDTR
jgi:hypothetical protein